MSCAGLASNLVFRFPRAWPVSTSEGAWTVGTTTIATRWVCYIGEKTLMNRALTRHVVLFFEADYHQGSRC
jgi:hypothetical protein